jgi:hypothetical protein
MLWTPLGLAVGVGWPALLVYNDAELQKLTLIIGAMVFAFALVTLGVGWGLGIAPRSRRTVVMHVLAAALIAAVAAPYALTELLSLIASAAKTGAPVSLGAWLAAAPLAIMLGLPVALISGLLFAWIALARPRSDGDADDGDVLGDHIFSRDVQPFR